MKSSELWNKVNEVKELAVIALTDFIKNKIKDSINILPYVEQGYCTCIDIYGTKNGYGIVYNVNSIEVNNFGSIYITLYIIREAIHIHVGDRSTHLIGCIRYFFHRTRN